MNVCSLLILRMKFRVIYKLRMRTLFRIQLPKHLIKTQKSNPLMMKILNKDPKRMNQTQVTTMRYQNHNRKHMQVKVRVSLLNQKKKKHQSLKSVNWTKSIEEQLNREKQYKKITLSKFIFKFRCLQSQHSYYHLLDIKI